MIKNKERIYSILSIAILFILLFLEKQNIIKRVIINQIIVVFVIIGFLLIIFPIHLLCNELMRKKSNNLKEDGVYSNIRNSNYLKLLVFITGIVFINNNIILFFFPLINSLVYYCILNKFDVS